jgi:obg-like ATPase 1
MAARKKAEEKPRVLLGRPSNNLTMGIVGLPNVGKSTLFNILTKLSVPAENYPFCTIEPNEARVNVPDERYDWLVNFHKPASQVPAALSITDIAGLIRGASKGEGLGNAFLSHIRAVDGIFHVIRIFEDADVTHVEGGLDPVRDLTIVIDELILKDIEMVEKKAEALERELSHKKDKKKLQELEVIQKVAAVLKSNKQVRLEEWKATEIEVVNSLSLLTAKPTVYIVNMSEPDFIKKGNKWLGKIKAWVDANGGEPMVPFCGVMESKLLEMSEDAIKAYCEENKVSGSIPKIIKTGYHTLQLIHFFTCGADEVKCWTIRKGTKAPQAAGTIHTDFEKGFVCAEVMKFEEFKELGSEAAVKAAGKYKQEGKNYEVCDGDIIFFKANTVGLDKKK